MVNTKKARGSDLEHPSAVNSNSNVILTVCMHVRVRGASRSVRDSLPTFLSPMTCFEKQF